MESMGNDLQLDPTEVKREELGKKSSCVSMQRKASALVGPAVKGPKIDSLESTPSSMTRDEHHGDGQGDADLALSEVDETDPKLDDEDEYECDGRHRILKPVKKRSVSYRTTERVRDARLQKPQNSDEIGAKLKEELSKYKQELQEYNETTKDLEEKYMKINYELSGLQQKHDHFVATQGSSSDQEEEMDGEIDGDGDGVYNYRSTTSIASDASLDNSSSKIFRSSSSFMTVLEAPNSYEDLHQKKYPREKHGSKHMSKQSQPKKNKMSLSDQVGDDYSSRIVETLASRQSRRRHRSMMNHQHEDDDDDEMEDQENHPASIKDVYKVLKDVMNTSQDHHTYKHERARTREREREPSSSTRELYSTINNLKSEQGQYRTIIRQQKDRLTDYHSRCVKAQEIMKTQKHEIDKLHINNKQLESSIYHDIDTLRSKIDMKLKNISHLPQMMREEHIKYEKAMRENCVLGDKLRLLHQEANQLKLKIDELGRRKLVTINRLKAAERDLKIFKNYNAALKTEKRRLSDELTSVKEQLESLQSASKRQMCRHREQSEKQRRELQKRIFDLELKLSRSQNSTSSLIQERDSLIAELQAQLHTLVHNFEVSQKHIRVLRRHIYSMTTGGSGISGGGGVCGTASSGIGSAQSQRPSESSGIGRVNHSCQGSSGGRSNPRMMAMKAKA
ncbi:GL18660 [Drosophila persimilis]|uniref:GL18660 n=1 Tax=Drosophila persimilis TaxID=7234 RepID=B4G9F3_DROPE|nr:ribosome-binding protein 1 [Drosophila persimilis]EDW28983.1 GL18660 [Drosophila persimilis]